MPAIVVAVRFPTRTVVDDGSGGRRVLVAREIAARTDVGRCGDALLWGA